MYTQSSVHGQSHRYVSSRWRSRLVGSCLKPRPGHGVKGNRNRLQTREPSDACPHWDVALLAAVAVVADRCAVWEPDSFDGCVAACCCWYVTHWTSFAIQQTRTCHDERIEAASCCCCCCCCPSLWILEVYLSWGVVIVWVLDSCQWAANCVLPRSPHGVR